MLNKNGHMSQSPYSNFHQPFQTAGLEVECMGVKGGRSAHVDGGCLRRAKGQRKVDRTARIHFVGCAGSKQMGRVESGSASKPGQWHVVECTLYTVLTKGCQLPNLDPKA